MTRPGGDAEHVGTLRLPLHSVLVLLPPSETKHPGGHVPAARAALGLSPAQDDEIARNAALRSSPTMPAIERYTGVLYDALDVRSLTRAQRSRAAGRLAVGSALFGLLQ